MSLWYGANRFLHNTEENTMSKRTRFLAGMFAGALIMFFVFRGGAIYHDYQTFTIAIPNSLLKTAVVSPHDIKALTYTFNEAVTFATARAVQMKDNSNLKKLDTLIGLFMQHDEERYKEWLKKHKLFF